MYISASYTKIQCVQAEDWQGVVSFDRIFCEVMDWSQTAWIPVKTSYSTSTCLRFLICNLGDNIFIVFLHHGVNVLGLRRFCESAHVKVTTDTSQVLQTFPYTLWTPCSASHSKTHLYSFWYIVLHFIGLMTNAVLQLVFDKPNFFCFK